MSPGSRGSLPFVTASSDGIFQTCNSKLLPPLGRNPRTEGVHCQKKQNKLYQHGARMRRAALASEVAASWLRSGRWTPAWLAEAVQHRSELQIKVGAEARHFMYVGERRPDLIGDVHACGTRRELMPARELFEAIEHHAAPPFLYFTSPLSQLPGLLEAAPGWETLPWGEPGSETPSARGPSAPWAQLWAASAGATTQAHYDVADNTFVQLSGEKEFWIWPPEAHAALHLFPDSHPRSRKAQLDPEAPDATRHPLSAALPPPVRLLLAPGDVLRLPAFWLHHVQSRTPTVSLNLFADFCGVKAAAAEVLAVEMPLHAAWPDEVKRYGIARSAPRPPPPHPTPLTEANPDRRAPRPQRVSSEGASKSPV